MSGGNAWEYDITITRMTDFGTPLAAIVSGPTPAHPREARINVHLEGIAAGRLSGRMSGASRLSIRADGRMKSHVHPVIETDAGHRIALAAVGFANPGADSPIAGPIENVTLSTASPQYAWLNTRQIRAI